MTDFRLDDELLSAVYAEAVSWRHHLHQHPELAYRERQTSDFIAARLESFGLTVHRGLAGTGIVGTLKRGSGGRSIGIRADMDALPIVERSGVDYESRNIGCMHACGHDGHVAIALAAARICTQLTGLRGTVHFIFQPAEENERGGQRMVEEGLFKLFPCDAVYALHNWPDLPLGLCVVRDGPMMAAFGAFEITISGRGCHGAMPHQGIDALLTACHLATALQSIVSRNIDPLNSAVVSITQIHAGDTWNVIPEGCVLRGTTRWFSEEVGNTLEHRLTELSNTFASGFGCDVKVNYERRMPATINHYGEAQRVRKVIGMSVPELRVRDGDPSMGAEDFAFMLRAVPGCYVWLGTGTDGSTHRLHSPEYDFNDEALPHGVQLWVSLVRHMLA